MSNANTQTHRHTDTHITKREPTRNEDAVVSDPHPNRSGASNPRLAKESRHFRWRRKKNVKRETCNTDLEPAPSHGVLVAGGAVVDHDAVGSVRGRVPSGGDHQVDRVLDRNNVAHQIGVETQRPFFVGHETKSDPKILRRVHVNVGFLFISSQPTWQARKKNRKKEQSSPWTDRRNPLLTPAMKPVGPFRLSIQPGSGSWNVHSFG